MKTELLNIRTNVETKQLLKQASKMLGTTISGFLLRCATEEAHKIIQNQTNFMVDDKTWKEICNELDKPPAKNKNLQNLMYSKGVFSDE